MMKSASDNTKKDDQAVEQLLGRATLRPAPSAEGTERARRAVHEEWMAKSRRTKMRRQMMMLATAASIALALTITWQNWLAPEPAAIQVATVEKSLGTLFVAGNDAALESASDLQILHANQAIVTDIDSRASLAWGLGGSLRIDENSRLMLISERSVYLERGRIYFDSQTDSAEQAVLTIVSHHGELTHIGTQYMAEVTDETLVVSVREGTVNIDGVHHQRTADAGTQVRMSGPNLPVALNIGTYGALWHWVEQVAPPPTSRGNKLRELIEWASREMGRNYRFENAAVETAVDEGDVSGDLSQIPGDALNQMLRTNNLSYRLDPDNGDIIISQAGS